MKAIADILREAADKITALKEYLSIVTTKAPPKFRYFQRGPVKYKVQTANPSSCHYNKRNSKGKWVDSIMTLDDMLVDWGDSIKPIEYFPSKGKNEPTSKSKKMKETDSDFCKPIPTATITEPPEGFHPAMMGPIKVLAELHQQQDVASICNRAWSIGNWNGGSERHPYALRIGSDIARLNGLEPEAIPADNEPDHVKRREWYVSVNRENKQLYPYSSTDDLQFWQPGIRVREVLPGDPTQEQVEALVQTLQNAFTLRVTNHPTWEAEARKALQPFIGKEKP